MNSNEDNGLLNCFICFQKVRRAKMCPNCSKIGCYECLKLWFESSRSQCPYCRQQAAFSSFADCGRFLDELKEKLSTAEEKSKSKDMCPEHSIQMRYYCQTCKSPFCPDCSTFEDVHKGHKIVLLGKIHQNQKQKIHQQINKFDLKTRQYKKNGSMIKAKFEELTEQKKSKKVFLQTYLKERLQQIDRQFKDRQSCVLLKLENNQEQKELLLNLKETMMKDVTQYSQCQVISKSDQIIQFISTLCTRNIYNVEDEPSFVTTHEILPEFQGFYYQLNGFSSLDYSILYSEGYLLNGIEWRLKIYPKGNGQAKDKFISVFLEMTNAYQNKKHYQYRIQLINQKNQANSLTRQYLSMFDIGQCWGYNQFIQLDQLKSGFLQGDKLLFRFYIRPNDYKSQAADQHYYIKKLQTQVKQMQRKVLNKSDSNKPSTFSSKFSSIVNQLSHKRQEIKTQLQINNQLQRQIGSAQKQEIDIQAEHLDVQYWDD